LPTLPPKKYLWWGSVYRDYKLWMASVHRACILVTWQSCWWKRSPL